MCVCVCVCLCVHICTDAHIYKYIRMYVCIQKSPFVSPYMFSAAYIYITVIASGNPVGE